MTVTFRVVDRAEARDPHLRDELLGTWVAVTDAGGSVGFVAPAPVAEIAAAIDLALARVADGRDRLGVLVADDGAVSASVSWWAGARRSSITGAPCCG